MVFLWFSPTSLPIHGSRLNSWLGARRVTAPEISASRAGNLWFLIAEEAMVTIKIVGKQWENHRKMVV